MRWIVEWHRRASDGTITTARRSQAMVIEVVDRLVQFTGDRGTTNRVLKLQLDAMDSVLGDSPQLVEQSYDALERLVALHREFGRRLLDAVDLRDDAIPASDTAREHIATVHLLRTGNRSA